MRAGLMLILEYDVEPAALFISLKKLQREIAIQFVFQRHDLRRSGDGDSFTLAPSTSQSIFKTLANLIKTLESGTSGLPADNAKYSNEIGFALNNFDKANDNILRVRAMIGSRMNELDSLGSVNQDLSLQYQQTLSNLQDLDYAKAISDLTRKQTDLEAAQKSFMVTSNLSLFHYL